MLYRTQSKAASGLAIAGAIGTIVTTLFAMHDAIKAHDIIVEEEERSGVDLTLKEKAQLTWKCFIPTGISLGATLGCQFASHQITKAQIMSLAGSLSAMGITYSKLKDKVAEKLGPEIKKEFRVAEGQIRGESYDREWCRPKTFYDEANDIWFTSTEKAVYETEVEVEKQLIILGHVSCAEFYDILNQVQIKHCPKVNYPARVKEMGWTYDEMIEKYDFPWIDFDHVDMNCQDKPDEINLTVNDGKPYKKISCPIGPVRNYMDYLERNLFPEEDDIQWITDHPIYKREKN